MMFRTQLIKNEPRCEHLDLSVKSQGFPGGSDGKETGCNAGDLRLIANSKYATGSLSKFRKIVYQKYVFRMIYLACKLQENILLFKMDKEYFLKISVRLDLIF